MKEGLAVARELIRLGVLRVDVEGQIWKEKEIRNTGALVNVEPRRCEQPNPNGYLYVVMRRRGKQFTVQAHQIVWNHYKGSIPPKRDVNHRDGNKHHNAPRNLELVTRGENHRHAFETGLRTTPWTLPESVREQARVLRAEGLSFSQIAKRLGISQGSAFNLLS